MAHNNKKSSQDTGRLHKLLLSLKYNNVTRLALLSAVCFVFAVATACAFSPYSAGFSLGSSLFMLFLLFAVISAGLSTALKIEHYYYPTGSEHSKIFKLFNEDATMFPYFWDGGTSKASYRTYKAFLDSFGFSCTNEADRAQILRIIIDTASDNSYRLSVNENNWREVSEKLKEFGIESCVAAIASGVPIDDVFI